MLPGSFIENKEAISPTRARGVIIDTRRGGHETLVRFQNGRMEWLRTNTIQPDSKRSTR